MQPDAQEDRDAGGGGGWGERKTLQEFYDHKLIWETKTTYPKRAMAKHFHDDAFHGRAHTTIRNQF